MKIKIPQSGSEKPPSAGKVSPAVTPATTGTTTASSKPRRGKSCLDSWTCCDWVLVSFIVILGGGLVFKLIAQKTIMHRIEDMYPYHHDEGKMRAECKVVHVADNGMRSCRSCNGGIREDQLQHGWWDWMENGDSMTGWGKDGFFKHPKKCQAYLDFEKKTWEEFKVKTGGQTEEMILEEKIQVKQMLAKKQFAMCEPEAIKKEIEEELEEEKKFEKTLEGKSPEDIKRCKEEFRRKMEEKRRHALLAEEKKEEEKESHERTKRGFNKGHMGWSKPQESQFPCKEVIVEVNPQGKHKQWREEENDSWEGKGSSEEDDEDDDEGREKRGGGSHERKDGHHGGSHESHERRGGQGGHHPHHKHGDEKTARHGDMDKLMEEMKDNPPKTGQEAVEKMKNVGKNWENVMKDMKNRGVHHATLYDSKYTATNHKQCSVSICKGDLEQNKKCVGNFISEFEKMWEEGETFPCFYHDDNKMQAYELEPWSHQAKNREEGKHHHKMRLAKGLKIAAMAVGCLWLVLVLTFSIRRCIQCKRECGARRCQYASRTNEPQVVTVDPQPMTEKEKEAFGEPPVTPRSVWTPESEKYYKEPPIYPVSDESEAPSAPPSYVTLDASKAPDFKSALDAWASKQDGEVKKAEEASEA